MLQHIWAVPSPLPILVLSRPNRPQDRVQALDLGADELVTKPFSFNELSARVRALVRRGGRSPKNYLRIDDLGLHRVEHPVQRAGRLVELTPKEFSLLEYLMRNAVQNVRRAQIVEHVWNLCFDTVTNVVDVHINYSAAQVDQRRVDKLGKAVEAGFQQMGVFDSSASKAPVLLNEPISATPSPLIEKLRLGDKPDMNLVRKNLESALARELATGEVALIPTKEGIVVRLREADLFDSGSAHLRPQALPTLSEFVRVIGPERMKIRTEGHTDDVPIHNPKFDSNRELLTARAIEIIRLFVARFGIDPVRLSASGYGEHYPVSSNDSEAGRAKNRRVDLVVLNANAARHEPVPGASRTRPLPFRRTRVRHNGERGGRLQSGRGAIGPRLKKTVG